MPEPACRKLRDLISGPMKEELENSSFFRFTIKPRLAECLEKLGQREIEKLVCYGLGTFHLKNHEQSRIQLSLLLLIYDYLTEHGSTVSNVIDIYDPGFKEEDKETLKSFIIPSFNLLQKNELCARQIKTSRPNRCILFYMPHLEKELYNNVVGANWTVSNLSRIIIIGNSFSGLIDNELRSKRCQSRFYYINTLVGNFEESRSKTRKSKKSSIIAPSEGEKALIEIPLDDSMYDRVDVFNDLSIHLINQSWLLKKPFKIAEYLQTNWAPSDSGCFETDEDLEKLSSDLLSLSQ